MPAKLIEYRGKRAVRINWKNESRILTRYRGQRFTEADGKTLEQFINFAILTGSFRWDDWFPREAKKHRADKAVWIFVESKKRRPATEANYLRVIRRVLPHLEGRDLRELRRADFHWVRREHGDTEMAAAVRRVLQAFMNWAYREELTDRRVILPEIQTEGKATPYWSQTQRQAIFNELEEMYKAPAVLSLDMGMRIDKS